jgi:hypothetical protein
MKSFNDKHAMRRQAFVMTSIWLIAIFIATNGFQLGFWPWLMSFNQWDTRWYGTIAMSGHGFLPQSFVFSPGHSWILGALTDLTYYAFRTFHIYIKWMMIFSLYGLILNVLAFGISNLILVWLSSKRWNISKTRMWAICFSNPMGYFALTAYSDMIFLLLTMCILVLTLHTSPRAEIWALQSLLPQLSTRAKRMILTTLLAAAPWFRLTGAAFASLIFLRRKEVIGTLIGVLSFLTYYWVRTDDPFYFLKAQRVFQMPEGYFLDGLTYSVAVFLEGLKIESGKLLLARDVDFLLYWINFGLLPLMVFFLSLATAIWLALQNEWEFALVLIAVTAISHNQAMWRSTVRYALMAYPVASWLWLKKDSSKVTGASPSIFKRAPEILTGLAVGTGFALQIFYARIFQAGGWAF